MRFLSGNVACCLFESKPLRVRGKLARFCSAHSQRMFFAASLRISSQFSIGFFLFDCCSLKIKRRIEGNLPLPSQQELNQNKLDVEIQAQYNRGVKLWLKALIFGPPLVAEG